MLKEKFKPTTEDKDKEKPRRRALSLLPTRKKSDEVKKDEKIEKKKPKDDTNKNMIRNFSFRGKLVVKEDEKKKDGVRSTSQIVPGKIFLSPDDHPQKEDSDIEEPGRSNNEVSGEESEETTSNEGSKVEPLDSDRDEKLKENQSEEESKERERDEELRREDSGPKREDSAPKRDSSKPEPVNSLIIRLSLEELESSLPTYTPPADPAPLFAAISSRVQQVVEDVSRIVTNVSEFSTSSMDPLFILNAKLLLLSKKTIELAKQMKELTVGSQSPSNSPVPTPGEVVDKFHQSALDFLANSSNPTVSSDPHVLAAAGLSEGIAKLVPKQVIQKLSLECDSLRLLGIHLISALSTLKSQAAACLATTSKKKKHQEIPNDIFMQLVTIVKSLPPVTGQLLNSFQTLAEIRVQSQQKAEKSDSSKKVKIEEEDDDMNIWDEKREITDTKCGNLNMLVNRLTSADSLDQNFLHTFVVTYRSFTTPYKLVEKLFQRYNVAEGNPKKNNIQMRVVIVIKYWVENQFFDFDDELVEKLIHFIDCVLPKDGLGDRLKNTINKKVDQRHQSKATQLTIPDSLTNSAFSSLSDLILQTSEEDIAKQLTLIDWKLFLNIETSEYLNQAWNKDELKYRSANLLTLISRLNKLSYWVSSLVLFQERLSARVNMFCKFINLAQHLHKLNNYNSLMGVLAGLNMSSVIRLHHTRAKVPSKTMASLKSMEKIMNPENSFKNYRGSLRSGGNPKLPYLGVDLRDLTFIEDGNPDKIDGMINFQKRELVHNVIQEIQTLKNDSYNFLPIEPLYTLLNELPYLSENDLYQLSLTREPRNSTSQQIVQ